MKEVLKVGTVNLCQRKVATAVVVHHPHGMAFRTLGVIRKRLHDRGELGIKAQTIERHLLGIDAVPSLQDHKVCRHDAVVAEICAQHLLFLRKAVRPVAKFILREADYERFVYKVGYAVGVATAGTSVQLFGNIPALLTELTGTLTVTHNAFLQLIHLVCAQLSTAPFPGTCLRLELLHPTVIRTVVEGHKLRLLIKEPYSPCMSRIGQAS